ncbi:MAG TPA: class I SAM-dependent methyltransferase [Desulfobulbaceae bacterium]|nr:class I SAM-dependent methyltransferase [Desulfobulbaceae bacterium]
MTWEKAMQPFNERAAEYDGWFADNPVFTIELAALLALTIMPPRPRLEIGVGPGRFAQALGIDYGIDPAISPLQLSSRRGILVIRGTGEHLPVRQATIGTVYLLFTLCFLTDPLAVLGECTRVLRPGGRVIIGLIPSGSAWGKRLSDRGKSGDPFYRHARFRSIAETMQMLAIHGYQVEEAWSTLRQQPGRQLQFEPPKAGAEENAGFCVLMAGQQGALY